VNIKRFIITSSISLGIMMAFLDTNLMSIAMPEIKDILGDFKLYSWVFSLNMLANTITVPIYGKLADLYGRKRTYLIALGFFMLGTILCGFSTSMLQLVIFHGIKGLGTGGLILLSITIAGDMFLVKDRGKIEGIFSLMTTIAALYGPFVGMYLLNKGYWNWIFWLNIPLCLIVFIGVLIMDEKMIERKGQLDVHGALIFMGGASFFFLATLSTNLWVLLFLLISGSVLIYLFLRHERKTHSPMLKFEFFNSPLIKWSNISATLISMGIFFLPNIIPLYAKDVLGYSMINSGLLLLSQVLGWNIMAVFSGKIIILFGYRRTIGLSLSLMAVSIILFILTGSQLPFPAFIFIMFLLGMGFGLSLITLVVAVQEVVKWNERGISTSLMIFSRNVGTTIGLTIAGGLITLTNNVFSLEATFKLIFLWCLVIAVFAFYTSNKIPLETENRTTIEL
jgi:MFS family permease